MTQQLTTLTVEQALYGYSDGHRQLAASVQLSSVDAYELATRSDLASNARLAPGTNYVCGFALKDSGAFAFIKTWPAPEMPRPGCVWSHVLVLPRKFLTGQVNLGVLKTLFQKPGSKTAFDEYSRKIEVSRLTKSRPADRFEVQRIISAYYKGRTMRHAELPGEKFEEALLAAWSQQWPRLRSDFQFRMVFGSAAVEDERGLIVRIGPTNSSESVDTTPEEWLSAAVDDATSPTITPLRRFLWRYGKDTARPRAAFQPLVELYLAEAEGSMRSPAEILRSFPKPLDAATLKRDALGVTPAALSLTGRLSGEDFVTLALRGKALSGGLVKREELETTIGMLNQRDLKGAAIALGSVSDLDFEDAAAVAEEVSRVIGPDALSDEALPLPFVMRVLAKRPQLIEDFDVARLKDDDVLTLLKSANGSIERRLIASLVSRAPSDQSFALLKRKASEAFVEAVRFSTKGDLHEKWKLFFSSRAKEVIPRGLSELEGSKQISHAVALIDFSTEHELEPAAFVEAAGRAGPVATDAEQADLDVYLLVMCRWNHARSMKILVDVLPRLRSVALANAFSTRGRALLDRYLPYVSESWDLNKRLLKLLRNARRDGANIDGVVERMSLSKDELFYVFDDDSDELKSFISRLFWPIYPG